MSAIAKANIFEWLNDHGRATKIEIYAAFALVTKRVVDVALQELLDEKRIIAGETHFAPARVVRKSEAAAPPLPVPPSKLAPKPLPPGPPPTTRQRIKALFRNQHSWEQADIFAALSDTKPATVLSVLYDECRRKDLFKDGTVFTTLRPKPAAPSNTPSDASEAQRTPEATGTSTKPEAVATPTPVADEHDEGAQTFESPPPAMGPAEAPGQINEPGDAERLVPDPDAGSHREESESPLPGEGQATACESTEAASAKASESPPSAIGPTGGEPTSIWLNPAPQPDKPLVPPGVTDPELHRIAREILADTHAIDQEPSMSATVTRLHAEPAPRAPETGGAEQPFIAQIRDVVAQVLAEFGGGGGGGGADEPMVIFSLRTDDLEIEITGNDLRALKAIKGVLHVLPESEQG